MSRLSRGRYNEKTFEIEYRGARDRVIDVGPGAGNEGGTIVATGTPEQIAASRASRTAPYLARALNVDSRSRAS